ncbi:MAG: tripartite tricarboxylate transporter TctB family protein [Rhizobiaceae bacterium]|nr:tripartite tricarboxylate transporter TctB family protein [Rhizobiaceae bacterium]
MSDASGAGEAGRTDRAALVIAAILLLAGLAMAIATWSSGTVAMSTPVGPKTVPFIIAGALVILGVLTAVAGFRGDFPAREKQDIPPMVWIVGGLAVQMLTMKTIGFSIATGLLFAATARGFGRGPLWQTVPIGIVFSFIVWIVFAKGLQLSLPAGPLERLF